MLPGGQRKMSRGISIPPLVLALLLPLHAQSNPYELLQRAIARVHDILDRMPNYICTQTMERSESWGRPQAFIPGLSGAPKKPAPESGCYWTPEPDRDRYPQTDRVRVDLLLTSAGERYSWPRENRFQNRDLLSLVPIRENSTGGFGGFLRSIFAGDNVFEYRGETVESGRAVRLYAFRVAREKSEYWFGTGTNRRIGACEGTFLVDPETADLVRLVVRSSEPPELSGACRATTTLSYSHRRVNDADLLLPSRSVLEFVGTVGEEATNISVYSDCHEFRGESTLRFEPPQRGQLPSSKPSERPMLALPEGLPFRIAFTEDISYRTAAAGDTFAAKLTTPIQYASKHILVPAGAPIAARILDADFARAHRMQGVVGIAHLIFRLESLTINGVPYSFTATTAQRIASDDPMDDDGVYVPYHDPNVARLVFAPNTALLKFYDVPSDFVLKAGRPSKWITGGKAPTVGCLSGMKPCK